MTSASPRAREWVEGLQSKNGGWGAFDADNEYYYLNHIPFADHGALLDPPTADVSARCVSMLAQLGDKMRDEPHAEGRRRLSPRRADAGRQLVRPLGNELYIRNMVDALRAQCGRAGAGASRHAPRRRLAASRSRTRTAAGERTETATSSTIAAMRKRRARPSQTAWGVLGADGGGRGRPSRGRARRRLSCRRIRSQDGLWKEERFTATGFPRVFYLRYHGYAKFFPLWALARYPQPAERQQQNCPDRTLDAAWTARMTSSPRAFSSSRGCSASAPAPRAKVWCRCAAAPTRGPARGARAHAGLRLAGVVSFGIAGGLDPALRPGDVVDRRAAVFGGERYETSADSAAILSEGLGAAGGKIIVGRHRRRRGARARSQAKAALAPRPAPSRSIWSRISRAEFAARRRLPLCRGARRQ